MPRSRRIDPDEMDRDEEETTPRRRRRTADEDEEETTPRRRRGGSSGETVEREDDPYDDDDDDDEPAPRRRRRADEDDEEPAPRRRRRDEDDEDEDDEPTAVVPISRGRKDIKKNRPVGEGSDAYFKWDEEDQVVKFLDEEPWAYDQHWVKRSGKQSFPCLGEDCPLCEIGVKVSQKIVYSLVNLSHKGGPRVQTLEVGITLDETLMKYHEDKKTGPLDRLYWALSRTERSGGGRAKYNYTFTPIKERDLDEDWEIDIRKVSSVIEDAVAPSTSDVLGKVTRRSLQEIADEALGR